MPDFVHLHNHTHYSLLDAACTVKGLVKSAADNNMSAVALTDHGVTFGLMEFYKDAKKAGLKPLLGCEVYVASGSRFDKVATSTKNKTRNYYHLVLLAKNLEGYRNLSRLTSLAHTEGFYYKPRIDREIIEKYKDGLICLSACVGGVVSQHLVREDRDAAKEAATWYRDQFGDDFYLEIQNHFMEVDKAVLSGVPDLAKELGVPLVATNDIHYISPEHAVAHNCLLHIRDAGKGSTPPDLENNLRYGTPEYYFKSAEQMHDLFKDFPEALQSTLDIAAKCDVSMPGDLFMPKFPIPEQSGAENLDDYLHQLTWQGMDKRYPEGIADDARQRCEFELDVITRMGYSGYFLIVQDFIQAARDMGVSVGPGRGSAAGSLVAYALGITNVDPLKYDLLFERFLNPDRVSMPDIDVDFSDDKRELVIEYCRQKYGHDAVSQIITFGTLSSRAVLKDVGRVLGIPLSVINSITDKITVKFGRVQKIAEALNNPELRWVKESEDPQIKKLTEYSLVLEGLCRNSSLHAAGVVIAPGPLQDYVPLYKTPDSPMASQYTMNYLEDAGLLKMDFLGLRTLSIIDKTLEVIQQRHGVKTDIDALDLDDPVTYDLIGRGLTTAVFQFESPPMQDYLRQLKPASLEDLTAMNALYRPGPMANIPDFIDRKHGRKPIEYLHPLLEPILGRTYGICVYQEQIMQIAQQLGGFTLAQADTLRRAMGKKQVKYMEEMHGGYLEGCRNNGVDKKAANEIWEMMVRFADYGFNKSHSLAYSYLAFQTAWLKAHYTAEFLAANMTAEMNDLDKVVRLIDEARKFDLRVLPPDVNQSNVHFTVTDDGIRFGMAAIRNVGESAVQAILVQRGKDGPFTSIFDFAKRLAGTSVVNKRLAESLVQGGAFDTLHKNRRQCFEALESAMNYAASSAANAASGMESLFATGADALGNGGSMPEPALPKVEDWPKTEQLRREKEVLNLYVSGHPMEGFAMEVDAFSQLRFGQVDQDTQLPASVRACGIISAVRTRLDKRENRIAFVTIEDFTGKAECIFWSDAFKKHQSLLREGETVFVIGRPEVSGADGVRIVVDDVVPVQKARERFATAIAVNVQLDQVPEDAAVRTRDLFQHNQGGLQCIFRVYTTGRTLAGRYMVRRFSVSPTDDVMSELRRIYGPANVSFISANHK